jgi:hypothetical protein
MSDFKYAVKLDGVRVVHRPQFPGDTWYGFEAIVIADDGKKYYLPLFGAWKQKDRQEGGHYYQCDNNSLIWKYLTEVKEHALQLANEIYGEGI